MIFCSQFENCQSTFKILWKFLDLWVDYGRQPNRKYWTVSTSALQAHIEFNISSKTWRNFSILSDSFLEKLNPNPDKNSPVVSHLLFDKKTPSFLHHPLLVSECKRNLSSFFFFDVPRITLFVVRHALHCVFYIFFWKFSLFGLSYKTSS